jgi:hypothetical protein
VDRPIKICRVPATCQLLNVAKCTDRSSLDTWQRCTNQVITRVTFWHVVCWVGFINGTHQSAFDTWPMAGKYMPRGQWTLPETSTQNHYGPSNLKQIFPRGCHVSDGSLHKLHRPMRAWHVAYGVTRGIFKHTTQNKPWKKKSWRPTEIWRICPYSLNNIDALLWRPLCPWIHPLCPWSHPLRLWIQPPLPLNSPPLPLNASPLPLNSPPPAPQFTPSTPQFTPSAPQSTHTAGNPMVAISWQEMQDPSSLAKEFRKVAKVVWIQGQREWIQGRRG